MSNIVKFPGKIDLDNIPECLRELADSIEKGSTEESHMVGCVLFLLDNDDDSAMYSFGKKAKDPFMATGIVQYALREAGF